METLSLGKKEIESIVIKTCITKAHGVHFSRVGWMAEIRGNLVFSFRLHLAPKFSSPRSREKGRTYNKLIRPPRARARGILVENPESKNYTDTSIIALRVTAYLRLAGGQ